MEVVMAYEGVGGRPPVLIMLGAASYARDLDTRLRSHASDHILFPGALYGRDYRTLQWE
jgi:hypothetical protein